MGSSSSDEDEPPSVPDATDEPADEPPMPPEEANSDPSRAEAAAGDEGEPVAELETRVDELEDQIQALEKEKEELTDTLARVQADYENFRKRAKRERREAARDARVELVQVLVEVSDNVQRAMDADPDPDVRKGLELVERQIDRELDALGVETIEPAPGEAFDPSLHEPMIVEETDEHDPDTVVELLQTGYDLDGRQIRPARVKVARAPDSSDDRQADEERSSP